MIVKCLAQKLKNVFAKLRMILPTEPEYDLFTFRTLIANTEIPLDGIEYTLTSITLLGQMIVSKPGPDYGSITFNDVPYGIYILEPTKLAEGFKPALEAYTIIVERGGNVTICPGVPRKRTPECIPLTGGFVLEHYSISSM